MNAVRAGSFCTVVLFLHLICRCAPDAVFKDFCNSPPHFGVGTLSGNDCTVVYEYESKSSEDALDLCKNAAPYDVATTAFGQTTSCLYANSNITCRRRETAIGKRCFRIGGNGQHSKYSTQCGWVFLEPHVIENDFEREWITALVKSMRAEVWTKASADFVEAHRPIPQKVRSKRASDGIVKREAKDEYPMTIRMKGGKDVLEGTLRLRDPEEKHPFLCSRIPKPTDKEEDFQKNETDHSFDEVEYPSTTTEEPEETTASSANKVTDVKTTAEGKEPTTEEPEASIKWDFITLFPQSPKGTTEGAGQSGTTGGEGENGGHEITPGQEPEPGITFPGETTGDGSHVGEKPGGTRGTKPEDGTTEGSDAWNFATPGPGSGISKARKSIVFLLDARMLAMEDGWKNMVELVVKTAGRLEQTRVAIIAISCPSEIIVPMGIYTSDYLRSRSLAYKSAGNKIATSQAYSFAKKLLDAETTKAKSVAVFSDGESSTCDIPGTDNKDEPDIANTMRKNGTNIVFVPTGELANQTNVDEIVDNPNKVLDTKDGKDVTAKPESREAQDLGQRLLDLINGKPVELKKTTASQQETSGPESGDRDARTPPQGIEESPLPGHITPDETLMSTPSDSNRDTMTPPEGTDRSPLPDGITSSPDASGSEARKSIVFLLDARMLAMKDGWKNMVELVAKTAGRMEQTRVAVIAMSCPSEIIVPMGIYTSDYLRSQSLAYKSAGDKIATSQAYSLAKKLLDAETTKDKSVVVFSDGQSSTCDIPGTTNKDEPEIADTMRKNGTDFVFVPTGELANQTNVDEIVDNPNKVLDTRDGKDVTAKPDSEESQDLGNRLLDRLGGRPEALTRATVPESGETSTAVNKVTGIEETIATDEAQMSTPSHSDRDTVTPPGGIEESSPLPDQITPSPPPSGSEAEKSIVFLLDARMLAMKDGWKNMVEIVVKTARRMEQTRVAVIAMSCPSEIIVPMGVYTSDYLRSQSLAYKTASDKIATSQAYSLAKKLLDAETTKDKSVAVFSDGQSSTCDIPGTRNEDEPELANTMRKNGTDFVFVPTGELTNKTKVDEIVDDPNRVLDTKDGKDVAAKPDSDEARELGDRLLDLINGKPVEPKKTTGSQQETSGPESGETSTDVNKVTGFEETVATDESQMSFPSDSNRDARTPPGGVEETPPPDRITPDESQMSTPSGSNRDEITPSGGVEETPPPDRVTPSPDASATAGKKSIVFILDAPSLALNKGWKSMVELVVRTVKDLQQPRVAVIAMGCPSEIVVRMGIHTVKDLRMRLLAYNAVGDKIATSQAYSLARKILRAEKTKDKSVVVFSNGQSSSCSEADAGQDDDQSIAHKWDIVGVKRVYVGTGEPVNKTKMQEITRDPEKILDVKDPTIKPDSDEFKKTKDRLVKLLQGTSAITTEVPITVEEEHPTTPVAPQEPTDSQPETPPSERREPTTESIAETRGASTASEVDESQLSTAQESGHEATTTAERPDLDVTPIHITSRPDTSSSGATKSIVFLLDASSAVQGEGWKNMVEIVVGAVEGLKQPRVAAIAMSCSPEVVAPMDIYTSSDLRKELLAYHPAGGKIATSRAYKLAKKLLDAEITKDKSVVVFSNGQSSTCMKPGAGHEDERDTADKLRKDGSNILYVPTGEPANKTNMNEIAQDPNNVADVKNLSAKQDPDDLKKVKDWIVGRLKEAPMMTTEAYETTEGEQETTPVAAEATAAPQTETPHSGGHEPSTTAELLGHEETTTPEGADFSAPPAQITPAPDDGASATKAVVFLLDASSAALGEGWKNMVEIVVRTVNGLKDTRVAAVAMSCPSEVLLHMDIYTPSQMRKELLAYHPAGGKIATSQAYGLARDLLKTETTKDKSVVVFSNGQSSTCDKPGAGDKDEPRIAQELRNNGADIVYVEIEEPENKANVNEIAQDPNKVIDLKNITKKLDPEELNKVVDWLGTLLNGAPQATTEASTTAEEVTDHPTEPMTAEESSTKESGGPITFPIHATQRVAPVTDHPTAPVTAEESSTKESGSIITFPIQVTQRVAPSTLGSSGATKSIVFILDASSPALVDGWKSMAEVVVKTVDRLEQARVAVIALSCPAEIVVPMGTYTQEQLRKDLLAYNKTSGTIATHQGYSLARMLLKAETTKDKSVVIFSNGQSSTCHVPRSGEEDERGIAIQWHRIEIEVFYIVVSKAMNITLVGEIATDPEHILNVTTIKVDEDSGESKKILEFILGILMSPTVTKPPAVKGARNDTIDESLWSCPPGTRTTPELSKAVVLMLDTAATVQKEGWTRVIDFAMKLLRFLKGARVGVVVMGCPSKVLFPMGIYTESELRKDIPKHTYANKKVSTYQAFKLSRELLNTESVQEKTVIILSDLGSTFCSKTQNAQENEFTIAEEWRRNKVRIVYVAVEEKYKENVGSVPGGAENILRVTDFGAMDKNVAKEVPAKLCAPVEEWKPSASCQSGVDTSKITKSLVFILDASDSVNEETWNKQMRLVTNMKKHVQEVETLGVVIIDCPSDILLPMGSYTIEEIGNEMTDFQRKGEKPAMYQAFGLADALVRKNPVGSQTTVVVVSNGKTSECNPPLTVENEFTLAQKWRTRGTRIIYVALQGTQNPDMNNIRKITEDPGNIVEVDIDLVDTDGVARLLPKFCGANTPTTTLSPPTTTSPKPGVPGVIPTPGVVKSLVFIVDASGAVTREAWNGQIQLVTNVVKYVKVESVAIVAIDCDSDILLPRGSYPAEEIGKQMTAYGYRGGKTATHQAFGLARVFVYENLGSETIVIVMSDGKTSDCRLPLTAENEFTIAQYHWRARGVRIIYVALRGTPTFSRENIDKIAGGPENIVEVDDVDTMGTITAGSVKSKLMVAETSKSTATTTTAAASQANAGPLHDYHMKPTATKHIVFIVDASGSVSKEAWDAQTQFVTNVMKSMNQVDSVGISVIDCPSDILLAKDHHEVEEISNQMKDYGYRGKATATHQAFALATAFIPKNQASGTVVIVVSNGKTSDCNLPLTSENEFTIAEHQWRHYGARIIYVALRWTRGFNMDNVEQVTEDPANIIPVDDLNTLATTAADAVLMKFPPPA